MDGLHATIHPVIEAVFPIALALTLVGTAACLLALVARRIVRSRLRAGSRFLLLALALVLPATVVLAMLAPIDASIADGRARVALDQIQVPPAPAQIAAAPAWPVEMRCALAGSWLAGAMLLLALEALRFTRAASSVRPARDHEQAHRIRSSVGHIQHPVIVASGCTDPMVQGLLRSRIVLPEEFARRLSAEELGAVLAHEIAHVERRDNAIALLLRVMTIAFWFDPFRWLVLRAAMDERERACDERVVEAGHHPEMYVNAVLKSCGTEESLVAACVTSSRIGERIDSIMNFAHARFLSPRLVSGLALSVFIAASFGFAIVAPRPMLATMISGESTGAPSLELESRFVPGEKLDIVARVRDGAGNLVSAPRIIVPAGEEASISSTSNPSSGGEVTWRVTVQTSTSGSGTALLERVDDGIVTHTSLHRFDSTGASQVSERPPIDMVLSDADLRDVLQTFSQLTGNTIEYDDSVQGRVSIDVDNAPWDQVLAMVLGMNGYSYEWIGADRIRVRERTPSDPAVRLDAESIGIPGARSSSPVTSAAAPGFPRISDGTTDPVVIERVSPRYPDEERKGRVQGEVVLATQIDETGAVTDVRAVRSVSPGLELAAIEAVRQWKFRPATRDGRPVPVTFHITINFSLDTDPR